MTYPPTPTNAKQAHAHAKELAAVHGGQWIPIRRIDPLPGRFAINFTAIMPHELDGYPGWEVVPPLTPPTKKTRRS